MSQDSKNSEKIFVKEKSLKSCIVKFFQKAFENYCQNLSVCEEVFGEKTFSHSERVQKSCSLIELFRLIKT